MSKPTHTEKIAKCSSVCVGALIVGRLTPPRLSLQLTLLAPLDTPFAHPFRSGSVGWHTIWIPHPPSPLPSNEKRTKKGRTIGKEGQQGEKIKSGD